MTDQLLNVLKVALLALIYLFFARVLWAVWSEVRTPAPVAGSRIRSQAGAAAPKVPRGTPTLVVLEPREARGVRHPVTGAGATIGRESTCTIARPDDTFISGVHARFEMRGEALWVVDLRSTNGTFVNGQRLNGERALRKGDRVQTGSTVVELQR